MKTTFIYLVTALLLLLSCKENASSKTERSDEPDVYSVEDSNAAMNEAIEEANNAIQVFQTALLSENPSYNFIAIKQKFETFDGGAEHIWVQDIQLVDNDYIGIVGNEPVKTNEVQLGDTITVNKNNISDWMYYDREFIKGGYTIKALRYGMSKEERTQFDIENGLLFE